MNNDNIFYTTNERGLIKKFPVKIKMNEAVRQLRESRVVDNKTKKCSASLCGYNVSSVFFTENDIVIRIWSSVLNGYRPFVDKSKRPKLFKKDNKIIVEPQ